MSNTRIHNSRFFKADQRLQTMSASVGVYTSEGEEVSVDDVFVLPENEGAIAEQQDPYIILPLVGKLLIQHNGNTYELNAEEAYTFKGDAIIVQNPFAEGTVNFLKITLHSNHSVHIGKSSIALNEKNELKAFEGMGQRVLVGVYDSRIKGTYRPKKTNGVYVFVINGSFEVEDRLMEHRDGLALIDAQEIDFESLSETALLLIIEF